MHTSTTAKLFTPSSAPTTHQSNCRGDAGLLLSPAVRRCNRKRTEEEEEEEEEEEQEVEDGGRRHLRDG